MMSDSPTDMDWAPKVAPDLIRLLYENDHRGLFDEELLQEVGYRLLARCKDILEVSEAVLGKVHCRKCNQTIPRLKYDLPGEDEEILLCPQCDWQTTWGDYFHSITGRKLRGGEVVHIYRNFVERIQNAKSAQEKMIAIDYLIHEFHTNLGKPTKPIAVTVISGSSHKVKQLIEDLALK
jgi:hypothetical protein